MPCNDPVIPPKASKGPLTVKEPVINSWEEVIYCTIMVWAVNVPLTVKSSALEAVFANVAYDEEFAKEAYDALKTYDAVLAFAAKVEYEAEPAVAANVA